MLARSAQSPPSLNIYVSIHDAKQWLVNEDHSDASHGIAVTQRDSESLFIEFSPPFAAHASRAENVAERELAKLLAFEITALVGVPILEGEAEAIIDRHAPLGEKRRFLVLRGAAEEIVNTDGLPRFREIQAFEEHALADSVGTYLRDTLQVDPGEVSSEQKNLVCHAVVKYLYDELKASVAALSSDKLLEQLVARHESLIAQRRLLEITMATHLACFGDSEEDIAEFQKDFVSVDKASVASRFVIEYVATCPANGTHQLSMSRYDRLLAIASDIVYHGRISDSLHYQIGRQGFELLGSGRLTISDPRFESAMKGVQDKFYRRLAGNSREEFYRAVSMAETHEAPDDLAEIERVTAAEFGLPITQLVDLLAAIATSPGTDASGVGSCERSELVGHLSAATGLEEAVIDSVLCQFSLEERDDLLSPPPPYEQADVYPWRFNRGLSYLRRPVLTRVEGAQIWSVWGRRALLQAANYLVRLCSTGRLKSPQSAELSSYQGRMAERTGRRFNDHVATEVSKLPQYVVRKQIKKFDGKRIARINGESLGDVDVLAAEPTSQVIYPIEAKCFSLAKTPAELANEREELFGDLAGKAGAAGRHLERVDWIQENFSSVMRELNISSTDPRQWQIVPLMVLDSDLVSPRLVDPPFPVLALDELIEFLSHK